MTTLWMTPHVSGIKTTVQASSSAGIDANLDNAYLVQVTADDGAGGTSVQNLTVTVTPVNDNSPAFTSTATPSVSENTTGVLTVAATDADLPAQNVTFSLTGGVDQAKFAITPGGVLTFVAAPNYESPTDSNLDNAYLVQVTADDGAGGTSVQNLTVTVTPVNEVPTGISLSSSMVAENSPPNTPVGNLSTTDPDTGDTFTYSLTDSASGRFKLSGNQVQVDDGALLIIANASNHSITVRSADALGLTFDKTFTIAVTAANRAPLAQDDR